MCILRISRERTALSVLRATKPSYLYSTHTNGSQSNAMSPDPTLPSPQRSRRSCGKKTILSIPSKLHPLAQDHQATADSISVMAESFREVSLVEESSISSGTRQHTAQTLQYISQEPIPSTIDSPVPNPDRQFKTKSNIKSKLNGAGRERKVQPSKASGGVPNASMQYLQGCKVVPRPLRDPQDLLVVIDLNGTLLYRPNRKQPTKFLSRPHAPLFLKYCIDTFKVVIWSSAREQNVTAMCNSILTPEMRRKVVAIWGRDKFNLTRQDFELRVQCYKRLTSIWKDPRIATSHPAYQMGGRWDQTNTVLVDDSLDKGRSEPYNLIEVPEWTGDVHDIALPQVHDYLNHLSLHSNVSGCLYAQPFKPQLRR